MKRVFSFAVLAISMMACLSSRADTAAVSFSSPGIPFSSAGTTGYSLGWEFTTNGTISVTSLGYLDDGGLTETHDVGIYDSTGVLLASATIDGSGTQDGFFNYVSIAPLTLTAGQTYQIMATSGLADIYTYFASDMTVDPSITYDQDEYSYDNVLSDGQYSYGETVASGGGAFGPNFLESSTVAATPEPGSLALLATGLLGFAGVVKRRLS
jgi:hypothetical protein